MPYLIVFSIYLHSAHQKHMVNLVYKVLHKPSTGEGKNAKKTGPLNDTGNIFADVGCHTILLIHC